jgi:multidrug efflux pump subunit AcrA (membrane-fusion protein)
VIVFSVIFIVSLAYGLMRFLIAQKEPPPVRRSIEARRYVRIEPISYKTIEATISEPGRLAAVSEVDIVSEASGKIEAGKVPLKKGAKFSKGDLLFTIYPDEAILSLKARKSQYQNTLASILPDLIIDFPEQEDTYMDFFNAISVDAPLPPLPEIRNSQLKIFLASRNVISEYYNIQRDELQLRRRNVRAPFDGTFLEVHMEPGAYTNTGGRVARAIRTDQLELEVQLQRADAAWVRIGSPVIVHSENRDLDWEGKVIRKSQFVDENTQRQAVFIKVSNESSKPILTGEYLNATFPTRPIDNVMEIPRNSVFNTNEVFVVKTGRLAKRTINVVKVNQRTLLFNGIPEGDSVVVQQLINVSEGTLVETDETAASGPSTGQRPAGRKPGVAADQKPGEEPKDKNGDNRARPNRGSR